MRHEILRRQNKMMWKIADVLRIAILAFPPHFRNSILSFKNYLRLNYATENVNFSKLKIDVHCIVFHNAYFTLFMCAMFKVNSTDCNDPDKRCQNKCFAKRKTFSYKTEINSNLENAEGKSENSAFTKRLNLTFS